MKDDTKAARGKPLLDWLREQKKRERRGVLAGLRCGLRPATERRAWPYLFRYADMATYQGEVARTVAGLYATHPEEGNTGGLGSLCLKLCAETETPWSDEKPGPMAMRLQQLLDAERGEICGRVIRMVLRCKAAGLPVDYGRLYEDLLAWDKPWGREKIRAQWAQQFWAPAAARKEEAAGERAPDVAEGPEGAEDPGREASS